MPITPPIFISDQNPFNGDLVASNPAYIQNLSSKSGGGADTVQVPIFACLDLFVLLYYFFSLAFIFIYLDFCLAPRYLNLHRKNKN